MNTPAELIEFYKKALANFVPTITPLGDGWDELSQPPFLAHAKSYRKLLPDNCFLAVMVELRKGRDDLAVWPDGRYHLSMSHNIFQDNHHVPGRIPTWYELKESRYKFLPKDKNFAIMFPPEDLYYNLHPTCLHLLEIPVSFALDPKKNGGI